MLSVQAHNTDSHATQAILRYGVLPNWTPDSKDKLKRSVDYMTNRRATPHPPLPEASLGKVQTTEARTAAIDALSLATGP